MNDKVKDSTGEIFITSSSVRCYHSLDFNSAKVRLKSELSVQKVDPYIVHVEDYESINDMVRRCVKTKTKLPIESNPLATYDSDEDIASQLPEYQLPKDKGDTGPENSDGKRSEPEESSSSVEQISEVTG